MTTLSTSPASVPSVTERTFVDMQRVGVLGEGDCLMACVASILGVPLESLPAITSENGDQWWSIFCGAARSHGFEVRESVDPPAGYSIAVGPSPRWDGQENHAVVALDGVIVHDPHPSRSGVTSIIYWLELRALDHPHERLGDDNA